MSERSSFCTEYVYCGDCLKAARGIFKGKNKYLYTQKIGQMPIIAGKHGGLGPYDDESGFLDLVVRLRSKICHAMRVVHIPDSGGFIVYWIEPNGEVKACAANKERATVVDVENEKAVQMRTQ